MSEIKNFEWEDSLSVGYNTIDLHHKKLLSIMGQFKDLLELPQEEYKLKIGKVIKNLSDYTYYHFTEEEKIMKEYEYPELKEHTSIHNSFIKKIKEAIVPLASGNIETGRQFYDFLGRWLVEHIAGADHKWSEYIHRNNPEAEF
ncbi:hemerythrin family protein [Treponema putidum]|uniref:Bacteriohemerythrin n=1 Tax=Treponema putidum TaxID=221027 RepID=A0AAE9MVI6_9SPIR|nr:hemerythrin family protein [Treponema putidum]AIN94648.1 hemerythrin [Treponema putidum]TWI78746.1 hemerythrin [Treponema putidum]UTY28672.1 bacteriohemerythrin [Treponema putidum]UTY31106.1 bacteriohemerythrin [Treponema putidum]UTY33537.1 bacteriohemerythrin [Treponema putidum]